MKTRIFKYLAVVALLFMAIPMQGQDFLNVYFKDGTFRIFHFSSLESLSTSSIDAEGYQHSDKHFQHITTLTDEYVYDLADIDRIEFTKYKEDVVLDNIANTMEEVLPLLSNCENIADAENLIENIKRFDNVEEAWSDGHILHVKIKDWETMSFHFNHGVEDEATMAKYKHNIKSVISKIKKKSNTNIQKPSVVIANQRDNNLEDKSFTSVYTSIVDALKTEGFDVEYVPMPSLDFFYQDMYDYDVVLLTTHGGYSLKRHDFMTGSELGKIKQNSSFPLETAKEMWKSAFNRIFVNPKYSKAQDDIGWTWHEEERNVNGQIDKYWVAYPVVFDSFFQHTASKKFSNPNSILFNSACMSLKDGNQVSDIFMKHRNLGTYLGYDESNYYGPFSGGGFILYLLSGMSAEKAKEELSSIVVTSKKGGDGNIVSGSYSKEDIDVYDSDGKYVKSYTAELKMLPEENLNRFVTKVCTIEKDDSDVNQEYSSNHSVKLEGVAGNRSDKDIKIYFGFEITYYDPVTNTWRINAETTPSDDKVEFYANVGNLQPGKTYYYRAYTYDGINSNLGEIYSFTTPEASTPYHDLCPDGNHPHMIDLGLPSGTKWSCCNVGASVPTAYGNYYAWGETSTKSTYTKENYKYHHTDSDGKYVYDDATFTMAPTPDQVKELFANCTATETSVDGVAGEKLTSKKNGKKIFLPYGGAKGISTVGVGEEYQYWTSQLEKSASNSKLLAPRQYSDNETDDLGNPYAFDWYEKDFRYIGKTVRKASK